jgi:hypothetical protein
MKDLEQKKDTGLSRKKTAIAILRENASRHFARNPVDDTWKHP